MSRGSRANWIMPLSHHSHHHSQQTYEHCAANNAPNSCNAEFTQACNTTVSGLNTYTPVRKSQTTCTVTVGSSLTRDDLMNSAFSLEGVKLPLNVTIWDISSTGGAMAKYDIPVLLSLSEVNVDLSSEFPIWAFLVILGCLSCLCCMCICICCECREDADRRAAPKVTCPNGHPLVYMGYTKTGWVCLNARMGCAQSCVTTSHSCIIGAG